MTETPKNVSEITFDWLQSSLREPFPSTRLTDMEIDASVGDLGYLGSICRVKLTFDSQSRDLPTSLIIKFPSDDEDTFANGTQLGAYAKEAKFYRHLANKGIGRAPRHYFSVINEATDDFVLAIEDLDGHRFVSQTEGASFADCEIVMKALAQFHAAHWQDEELGAGWLGCISDWGDANKPLIESGLPLFRKNFGEYVEYEPFLENWDFGAEVYGKVCAHLAAGPSTLMHGDAHIRNLAFNDSHAEPVRFYDWQLACRGPGAHDVLYFFVNSLPVADQNQSLDDLLVVYHDTLSSTVADYSMSDLMRDMAYSSLTFWGFISWLGNILPPNDATIELVRESIPRYMNLMAYLDSPRLIKEFG